MGVVVSSLVMGLFRLLELGVDVRTWLSLVGARPQLERRKQLLSGVGSGLGASCALGLL